MNSLANSLPNVDLSVYGDFNLPDALKVVMSFDKPACDLDKNLLELRAKYVKLIIELVKKDTFPLNEQQYVNLPPNFIKNVILRQLHLNLKECKECEAKEEYGSVILIAILMVVLLIAVCFLLFGGSDKEQSVRSPGSVRHRRT